MKKCGMILYNYTYFSKGVKPGMSVLLNISGVLLIVLMCIFLFLLTFCTLIFFSKVSIIFDYSKSLNIFIKIWFAKFNITKFMSRKKKQSKPKCLHYPGGAFGSLPEEKKDEKVKKKSVPAKSHKTPSVAKDKKTISETLDFVKNIISEASPHLSKCAEIRINRLRLTAATKEAADTAILFGNFNTAVSSLILVCEKFEALYINADCVGVYSDFCSDKPTLDANIELILNVKHVGLSSFKGFMFFLNNK